MLPSILWLWFLVVLCWCSTGAIAAEFTGLGDLPGGQSRSRASAVSADGRVVVGAASSAARGLNEGFVWTPETGMFGLGFLPEGDNSSGSSDVSADGNTIVGSSSIAGPSNTESFRWTLGAGMKGLGTLDGPDLVNNVAQAISGDGQKVVGRSFHPTLNQPRAYVWTKDDGMSNLPLVPWMDEGAKYWAVDITSDGSVIAGNSKVGNLGWGEEGFLWSPDRGYTHIAPEGEIVTTQVRAISDDGTTVVGGVHYIVDGQVPGGAMWWRADVGVVDVGGLPGNTDLGAFFYDISGNGRIAVGQDWLEDGVHPVIWDQYYGMRNLEQILIEEYGLKESLQGWKLERAFGVSEDGLIIVGGGINPQGNNEAWRVVLDEHSVPALLPGDANLDGRLDLEDFNRVRDNFGKGAFWYQGDFDGNHRVNFDDLEILFEGPREMAAVPEPATDVLLCLALAIAVAIVHRREYQASRHASVSADRCEKTIVAP